jgi:hypothetical protein
MKIAHSHPGRKALVMIAAAAICLQQGCRSAQAIPGQWLAASDTKLEDFSKQITSHLFENGMMVGVGNDDLCLYVFFTPDIIHRRRPPSRAQLTLWLDGNGGKAKKLGLVHISEPSGQKMPRPGTLAEKSGENPTGPGDRPAARPDEPASALLKIIDPMRGKELFITLDGSQGPAVRLAADWGDFAYQWRIPFRATGDWPGLNVGPGRVIGIGLLWQIKALAGSGKKDGERPGGGPPGGADRGGPGMGPPPGMESYEQLPGRGMSAESSSARRTIWLKMVLAKSK